MKIAEMPLRAGREGQSPNRIVIHAMGEYIDTDDRDYDAVSWLDKIGLSVHAIITPSGVVIRCRDDYQMAYHARVSCEGIQHKFPGCGDSGPGSSYLRVFSHCFEDALLLS